MLCFLYTVIYVTFQLFFSPSLMYMSGAFERVTGPQSLRLPDK